MPAASDSAAAYEKCPGCRSCMVAGGRHKPPAWLDLTDIEVRWLRMCGACDGGLPMNCICPTADPRVTIQALVDEVKRLRDAEGDPTRRKALTTLRRAVDDRRTVPTTGVESAALAVLEAFGG